VKDPRAPVPSAAAQASALKAIKNLYQRDYLTLKTSTERKALADKLLQKAEATRDDPVSRFVLLREARDLYSQSGEVAGAMTTIGHLAEHYAVDALAMKVAVLSAANQIYTQSQNSKFVVTDCLNLLGEAIAVDNFGAAQHLLELAAAAAKRTGQKALIDQVQTGVADVSSARKEVESDQAAQQVLKQNPDDADANLARGKYLCKQKGAWEQGLPLLARGADPILRSLAQKDQAAPPEAGEQAAVGDGWWNWAQKEPVRARVHLLRRAQSWYQRALPGLSGLTRDRLESRLAEVNTLLAASLPANSPSRPMPAKRAFAIEFNGLSDCILTPYTYRGSTPITLEAIVTAYSHPGDRRTVLGSFSTAGLGLEIHGKAGQWAIGVHGPRKQNFAVSDEASVLKQRVHLAGTFDPATRKASLFVNGKLQKATATLGGAHRVAKFPFQVAASPGKQGNPAGFFHGKIEAVRISHAILYVKDFPPARELGVESSCALLYTFQEGSGTQVKDLSGNNHSGKLVGGRWVSVER
jgi:hypothetical protein